MAHRRIVAFVLATASLATGCDRVGRSVLGGPDHVPDVVDVSAIDAVDVHDADVDDGDAIDSDAQGFDASDVVDAIEPFDVFGELTFPDGCDPVVNWDVGSPPSSDASVDAPVCPTGTACTGGATLTGRVTAPNGLDPVYGAEVYIAVGDDTPTTGLSCAACEQSPAACAHTVSGLDGTFSLSGVPAGMQRVVVRRGQFRRETSFSVPCGTTALPADVTRFPRNASEGSIPRIAVANGDFDTLECVLRKIGLDATAIDIFNNSTSPEAGRPTLDSLLADESMLHAYHILVINCGASGGGSPDPIERDNLARYVAAGGRLYVTDESYGYIEQVPAWSPLVCWEGSSCCGVAPEMERTAEIGNSIDLADGAISDANLAAWLRGVGATDARGAVPIRELLGGWTMQRNYASPVHEWVRANIEGTVRPMTVSFDINGCGRVVYSSYHTLGNESSCAVDPCPFPAYCNSMPLTPQERILEYLLFEAVGCVDRGP